MLEFHSQLVLSQGGEAVVFSMLGPGIVPSYDITRSTTTMETASAGSSTMVLFNTFP